MKREAIGVVEINFYSNAVIILDAMLKASAVGLAACFKTLGGRMVHFVITGSVSDVQAAMDAARAADGGLVKKGSVKVAVTISNPHPEILRILNLVEE